MADRGNDVSDAELRAQAMPELDQARRLAVSMDFDEVQNGQWFGKLLQGVVRTYNRNARASYFMKKYPGLPPDDVADALISVATRYAAITGGVGGVAATAGQLSAVATAGLTAPVFVATIGAEMLALAQIQMRLVLDLAVVYDLQLSADDPEDILMVFGYAMGVAPTDMAGRAVAGAAGAGAKQVVKQHLSKGTLKAAQKMASKIGIKLLQRTVIKYAVPVAGAAAGTAYNFTTTRSVGRIAKAHLRNRGSMTDELRSLVSRQNTYALAFPAAVMFMAQVDGDVSVKERELYKSMLTRMAFDDHEAAEFRRLVRDEGALLDALAAIDEPSVRRDLVEMLVLMAAYDGELTDDERGFLARVAERLRCPIDLPAAEARARAYRVNAGWGKRTTNAVTETGAKATTLAADAGRHVGKLASGLGDRVTGLFSKTPAPQEQVTGSSFPQAPVPPEHVTGSFPQAPSPQQPVPRVPSRFCSSCGSELQAGHRFCSGCGAPASTPQTCPGCGEEMAVGASFCPHCGRQLAPSGHRV